MFDSSLCLLIFFGDIRRLYTQGIDVASISAMCLLPIALWALWHFLLKPWCLRQNAPITQCLEVYLLFAWMHTRLLNVALLGIPDTLWLGMLAFVGIPAIVCYVMLFFAPNLQKVLFHLPECTDVRWGRYLPATALSLLTAYLLHTRLGTALAISLPILIFTLECTAAMVYNGKKYGKAAHICPDDPIE